MRIRELDLLWVRNIRITYSLSLRQLQGARHNDHKWCDLPQLQYWSSNANSWNVGAILFDVKNRSGNVASTQHLLIDVLPGTTLIKFQLHLELPEKREVYWGTYQSYARQGSNLIIHLRVRCTGRPCTKIQLESLILNWLPSSQQGDGKRQQPNSTNQGTC